MVGSAFVSKGGPNRFAGLVMETRMVEQHLKRLVAELREQQAADTRLEAVITANLNALGFGGGE